MQVMSSVAESRQFMTEESKSQVIDSVRSRVQNSISPMLIKEHKDKSDLEQSKVVRYQEREIQADFSDLKLSEV